MIYEIRVWKDETKMPNPEPKEEKSKLAKIANNVQNVANNPVNAVVGGGGGGNLDEADIIINKDGAGDDVIKTVRVFTELRKIGNEESSKKVKIIQVTIKGNLYLPIVAGGVTSAINSLANRAATPIEQQNTLRLFEWAQLQPDARKKDGYYRGLLINVKTKAGDFRVIRANNIYVESYSENYDEGEFGTFEMHLTQRTDVTSEVTIKGISGEKLSVLEQIKGGIDKAADKAGKAAAVIGTVGVVGKIASNIGTQVISTVETFTGETEATRRAKQAMGIISNTADFTSSTGNIVAASKEKDKNKAAQNISKELEKMSKNVNDSVKDGYKADTDVQKIQALREKVEKLEKTYYDNLSKEEKDVYARQDDKGKLDMLMKKKEIADKQIEIQKNQSIIEENKRQQEDYEREFADYEKKQAAADELDKKLKEAILKTLTSDDTSSTPSTPSKPSTPTGGQG